MRSLKPRRDQCFLCTSRSCYYRIWTIDGEFDEVACRDHQDDLEAAADRTLGDELRQHQLYSMRLARSEFSSCCRRPLPLTRDGTALTRAHVCDDPGLQEA